MRWTLHTDGGPRRVNHAAACVGDKIFSFGGYCSTEDYRDWDLISVHVLDTTIFKWASVDYNKANAPFQRYGHSCIAYGDKIYMWGGRNDSVACETLYCFDTKKLEWSTPPVTGMMPNGKDGHAACLINNKMYIFGGFEFLSDQYANNVHCLNLDTMEWSYIFTKGAPPLARDFHTALPYGNRMYVFGGRGDIDRPHNHAENEVYCDKVFYLDTKTETWVTVETNGIKPEGRRSHSGWIYNDFMYIFGGYNEKTKTHYNDVFRLSLKRHYWEPVSIGGIAPCKRRRQVCILHNDKIYLFGGTSPVKNPPAPKPDDTSDDDDKKLLDHNDLHILDYTPTLKVLCILYVLEHKLDTSSLPKDVLTDIRIMTQPNRISRPINQTG